MACASMGSRRQPVTSASVTTFFLNRRSSSSSDEHLGLGSRKALASGTHPAPHTFGKSFLGVGVGAMLGRQGLQLRRGGGTGILRKGADIRGQQQQSRRGAHSACVPPWSLDGQPKDPVSIRAEGNH